MKFTILGCGSSIGVPWITGNWGNCNKNNKFNQRTRCSAFIKKKKLINIDRYITRYKETVYRQQD